MPNPIFWKKIRREQFAWNAEPCFLEKKNFKMGSAESFKQHAYHKWTRVHKNTHTHTHTKKKKNNNNPPPPPKKKKKTETHNCGIDRIANEGKKANISLHILTTWYKIKMEIPRKCHNHGTAFLKHHSGVPRTKIIFIWSYDRPKKSKETNACFPNKVITMLDMIHWTQQ